MRTSGWKKLAGTALCWLAGAVALAADVEPLPSVQQNVTSTEFRQPIDLRTYGQTKSARTDENDVLYSEVGKHQCGAWLVGGAEATFLWPDFHRSSHNFTYVEGLGIPGQTTYASDVTSVDHNMLVGPRVWFGVQGCRWGLIGRYFNVGDTASNINPALPTYSQNQVFAADQFRAYYADIEAIRSFCLGRWATTAGFGVRYASVDLNNGLSSTLISQLGELVSASSMSRSGFDGTGITMGLWGSRQIRPCSAWNWFYSARASILWGSSSAYALTSATTIDQLGAAANLNGALAKSDNADLFIGELQYGIQWERQLKCIPSRAFFRFAGEYQYWDGSSSAQAAALSGAVAPTSVAYAEAVADSVLFDLVGFTIGAGLTY